MHEIRIKILGKSHPDTLRILNVIGLDFLQQKKYTECLQTFQEICKHGTQLGDNSDIVLNAQMNRGLTYDELGQHQESYEIYKTAHSKYIEILGENHPNILRVLYVIGRALFRQKKYTDCLEAFQQIYKHREDLDDNSEIILRAMMNIGLPYYKLRMYDESLH